MTFEPGEVVALKSGGQPMTVVLVSESDIDCIWIGEEGEFFHHSIPAVALTSVASEEDHDEEDEGEGESESESDEEDEGGEKARKRGRKAA
jgi:uncharacterized protein YodC (DUF2158 family)